MSSDSGPKRLVSEIKAQWREGQSPDAKTCLHRHPSIARQKSLALELAYEEYCLREEAGDTVNIQRFCGNFPSISHSLMKQIEVHQWIELNPEGLASSSRISWPKLGDTFFGFKVLDELGRGALARVYLCTQPDVGDRQVVVKVAHQGAYEAETLGRLKHPHIVPVYSVTEDDQSKVSCICMPFCGRSTLCDVLDLAYGENNRPSQARVILEAAVQRQDELDRYDRLDDPDRRMRSGSYVDGVLLMGRGRKTPDSPSSKAS